MTRFAQNTQKKKFGTFSGSNAGAHKSISAAERRFRSAIHKIRISPRGAVNRETQIEIAHLVNSVERYGFSFFPNHYVFDDIIKLEKIVDSITTKQAA